MIERYKIGLLGGSFDPVHLGHLQLAIEIKKLCHLNEVRFIPSWQPPLKKNPIATAKQRLTMLELTLKNHSDLVVDDCEIKRAGISYTIDTLRAFRTALPESSLCLIIGMDNLLYFDKWHEWQHIIEYANIIVGYRPGYVFPKIGVLADFIHKHCIEEAAVLSTQKCGGILLQPFDAVDISSSRIREKLKKSIVPVDYLASTVVHYIQEQKLYIR